MNLSKHKGTIKRIVIIAVIVFCVLFAWFNDFFKYLFTGDGQNSLLIICLSVVGVIGFCWYSYLYFENKPLDKPVNYNDKQLVDKAIELYCYDDSAKSEFKDRSNYIIDFGHHYQDKTGRERFAFFLFEGRKPLKGKEWDWDGVRVHKLDGDRYQGLVNKHGEFICKGDAQVSKEWVGYLNYLSDIHKSLTPTVLMSKKGYSLDELDKLMSITKSDLDIKDRLTPKTNEVIKKDE